jgi:hypothetical protein
LKRPAPRIPLEQPKSTIRPAVRGIEAVRADRKVNPPDEPEAVEGPYKTEAANAVSR